MTKLDLVAEKLLKQINELPESKEVLEHEIKTVMKSFSTDLLNMIEGLRANSVGAPVIKSQAAEYGITYNAKSKKFS